MNEAPICGIFIRELKNRFLCEVLIDNCPTECYVPSSCRLGNFLDLHGRRVLLLPTHTKNSRTAYSLLAVPYKRNYILLNSSKANTVIADNLHKRYFTALGNRSNAIREYRLDGYKSDIYLPDSKTIIEVKSVISLNPIAEFPTVFSQRTLDQLSAIEVLMENGFKAAMVIVSLNPYVRQVHIDQSTPFYTALSPCLEKGLKVLAVATYISENGVGIKRHIDIVY